METKIVSVFLHLSAKSLGRYYSVESYDLTINCTVLTYINGTASAFATAEVRTDPLNALRLKLQYDRT